DLLTSLILADQIRLIELINATWGYVNEIAALINSAETEVKPEAMLESLPAIAARHEEEIGKRFHTKWLNARQPIWRLICACAPSAWEFWTRLAKHEQWTSALCQRGRIETLTGLFGLSADLTRLLVLLESSSPIAAERLNVEAEAGGRLVLAA